MLPKNQPIDKFDFTRTVESKAGASGNVADQDEQLAHLRLIREFFLELLVPVVQRKERRFPKAKPTIIPERIEHRIELE
jgi:hypothetical protein